MNKVLLHILAVATIGSAFCACTSQDDIYQQYVKKGGYDYPAKAINLSSEVGYQRVYVNWEKPMDPAVRTAILYWDNYSKSLDVNYADYPDGNVSILVDQLEDRSYTFDIVNFDDYSNKSLASEITVSPYGDSWMVSRSERSVASAKMDGDNAKIVMTKSTDEMIRTRFRYKNEANEWVNCEKILEPGENEVVFPAALQGKRFQYSSSFCPKSGKDTVWRAWTTSIDGIAYKLNAKRWSVSATSGQVFSENTPEKIFDGLILSGARWHSSRSDALKGIFPKILSIDTQAQTGEEYAFSEFVFYENPESSSLRYIRDLVIYVSNKAYNQNSTDYVKEFGIPFLSTTLSTSQDNSSVKASNAATGRYFSIVFKSSWISDGFIDLWELVPYGYIPSQAD